MYFKLLQLYKASSPIDDTDKGISISDPENIKQDYLKYLNKPAGNNVKERIENLPKDFFLVNQPFQEYVENVGVYAHSFFPESWERLSRL